MISEISLFLSNIKIFRNTNCRYETFGDDNKIVYIERYNYLEMLCNEFMLLLNLIIEEFEIKESVNAIDVALVFKDAENTLASKIELIILNLNLIERCLKEKLQ
jgi:hypothetical protein